MVYMINEKTLLTFNYPYTHNIFTSVVDDGGVFSSRLSFVSWKLQSLKCHYWKFIVSYVGMLGIAYVLGKKLVKTPSFTLVH